jgi:hypothetical protein
MSRARRLLLVLALAGGPAAAAPGAAAEAAAGVVDLPLSGGALERVLYRSPEQPVAALILFVGGDGVLGLDSGGRPSRTANNFLFRTRDDWLGHGFAVAIPDAPSDHGRMGAGDPAALRAIIAHIRTRTAAPIWLVGTSMGTVRATYGAARLGPGEIAGLVLTSSVSRPGSRKNSDTVFSAGLDRVAVPTLVVSHGGDRCVVTPPGDAEAIRRGLDHAPTTHVLVFGGGLPARARECEGNSEHGYYGIETRVVDAIAAWITAR